MPGNEVENSVSNGRVFTNSIGAPWLLGAAQTASKFELKIDSKDCEYAGVADTTQNASADNFIDFVTDSSFFCSAE